MKRPRLVPASLAIGLLLVALPGMPAPGAGQEVVGALRDSATGEGVDGVFVMAVDSAGASRAGALTDEAGRFRFRLPFPGTFTLSAQRIGYRTTESPPLTLAAGQVVAYDLEADTEPVALLNLNVSAERRCRMVEDAGVTLSRLWEEARKAMLVAEWTRESGAVEMQIEEYTRRLDPRTLDVEEEERRARGYFGSRPYESLPAEELAAGGYIVEREDGIYYFAPDESVLLSESFLRSHCFQPVRDPERPGLIGLGFEPINQSLNPDIAGAFWLDESTAELRFVEYRYSRMVERVSAPEAGGRVEFSRLEGGAWVVTRWWIRMPQLAYRPGARGPGARPGASGPGLSVEGYVEEGGEVVETVDAREARARTRGAVEGRVVDRRSGAPLAGAIVYLSGTQYRTVTDERGAFRLDDLPPGTFPLVYRHERLDSLGTFARPVEVELAAGETVVVILEFPPPGTGP